MSTTDTILSHSYGFVTFVKEQDALSAVSALDKFDIAGRQVNVELAKPPSQTAAGRIPRQAAKAAAEQGLGATEGENGEADEGQKRRKSRNKSGRVSVGMVVEITQRRCR